MKSCKSLNAFLKKRKRKKDGEYTHTRIGNVSLGIYGGSYFIPTSDRDEFYKLYFKHVFEDKKPEYLTETQNKEEGGPLLVDLDLRYPIEIKERQYKESDISDIVDLYAESLQELLDIEEELVFTIFVFEKDEVNVLEEVTKDGIHLVCGLSMKHNLQMILRDIVMAKEKNETHIFKNIGCVNKIDDIFDECISSGRNNWQLWGSMKPNCKPYKLKYAYRIDLEGNDYDKESIDIDALTPKELLPVISAQNTMFPKVTNIKEKYKEKLKKLIESEQNKKKGRNKSKKKPQYNGALLTVSTASSFVKDPRNAKELNAYINNMMLYFDIKDYHIKEIHEIVMCLSENYYEPFKNWLNVGWALHNTHDSLFWTWVKFSSKSSKFDWGDIPSLKEKWKNEMGEGYTWRSLHYWAKQDNPQKYGEIRNNSIDRFIRSTLDSQGSDTDLAILTKHLFDGEYSCVSIKNHKWYKFRNHRWLENDCGTGLRSELSKKINRLYVDKTRSEKDMAANPDIGSAEREKHIENMGIYNRIAIKLKMNSQKNNIMHECEHLFYNNELTAKLDSNKYLLGFENGVYDFKQKKFRDGEAEDYISFSTRTKYIPYDPNDPGHKKISDQIDDFFFKVFPNTELREYIWQLSASCLIGTNRNQKFNILTGVGGNGKSIFVNLMNFVLGEYSGKMNIALVTQKRKGIGGPTPEIAQLKGRRFISMDEPSAGDVLNEGVMKQMVGGDEMEGRAMYSREMTKFYPQFELVCCTNRLFEIKSNDKGTWRRIRQVDFRSEFLDDRDYQQKKELGLADDPERPIYPKDDQLETKIVDWIQVFTARLIEKCNETEGKVQDCDMVLEASRAYQEKEDFWSQFVKEKIMKGNKDDRIKKTDIRIEFKEWYEQNNGNRAPKAKDLYEYLDKTLGKYRKRGWWGYKIIYEQFDSEEEVEEELSNSD